MSTVQYQNVTENTGNSWKTWRNGSRGPELIPQERVR